MRTSVIFWIFAILFLMSCSNRKEKDVTYLVINNKTLEKEIVNYDRFIGSFCKKSYVVHVYCIEKNDSITRYVISAIDGVDILDMFPFHFISKVNNKDVLFTMYSGLVKYSKNKNFFNLKDQEIQRVMKDNFPEEYKTYLENKEKQNKGEHYTVCLSIFEPEMYYLTFNRDKLIDKVIQRGIPNDYLPVDLTLEKEKVKQNMKFESKYTHKQKGERMPGQ